MKIVDGRLQNSRPVSTKAKQEIAVVTQNPTHLTGGVIMVGVPSLLGFLVC
jgi:hypothetical protein